MSDPQVFLLGVGILAIYWMGFWTAATDDAGHYATIPCTVVIHLVSIVFIMCSFISMMCKLW